MQSVTDSLRERAEEVKALLSKLLLEHSSLRLRNHADIGIMMSNGDHVWNPLDQEGRRLQSQVIERYERLSNIIYALLRDQGEGARDEFVGHNAIITQVIERAGMTWQSEPRYYLEQAIKSLDMQVAQVGDLHDPSEGKAIYVPDTNALLFNPYLETWRFADWPQFTLVLTPTVLSELDQLKVNHRVEEVRNKAEGLIKRIKEYRRRGRLTEGVTLVGGVSDLIALAVEPNMSKSLPWLVPDNKDDRLLAGVVEVMRSHVRSEVALVTRDINLQNKAEFAGLPFIEPPEPSS